MKPLKTKAEELAGPQIAKLFEISCDPLQVKLENAPKYFRRKTMTRLLALYEIFKQILDVKGSIIECGIHRGFGLMSWAQFSAVLEPANLTRRIYGFDSFEGFTQVHQHDKNTRLNPKRGGLRADCHQELTQLIKVYDSDRFLGHVDKVHMIKGDATKTIPDFLSKNRHLMVSLLFLDFDLYEPTKVAIQQFLPRMPKGAVLAFDELDNPIWPGETQAALEAIGLSQLKIRRLPWDPYIGYALLD
ncbi:MAG TPA: dTDP-6-deoxy-L-hexose 3-O-methyltransferase [Elusimicrobia bacterium]|nr:dTDP-6-deoxy-L-hexose 3-O-methyltransferase [Elusimicrobiota bacterium]HBT62244.1 dTDP-6-deoxy-L-hexose 3-O-methyltransferase [Elusimicrobiota bacterium]